MTPTRLLSIICLITFAGMPHRAAAQEVDTAFLTKWLNFQSGIRSLQGQFSQSRTLKTVRGIQKSTGSIYAKLPGQFRWESKDMIAVRDGEDITLMNVKAKMAKKEDINRLGGPAAAMDFASGNFPKTTTDFQKDFDIKKMEKSGNFYVITTQPKDRQTARVMREVTFYVNTDQYYLGGLDLRFRDGSNVSTRFTSLKFNGNIPASIFVANLEGYKVARG